MIGEKRKKVQSWSKSDLHGILPVNKEIGPTSHDTVNRLRNILGYRKIGHTGTLDPAACGLLLICLGKGCKIVQFLSHWDKEYTARIKLGEETDTYDAEGELLKVKDHPDVGEDQIEKLILSFSGESSQLAPPHSALKFKGKKLYEYARKGEPVPPKVRKVKIINIEVQRIDLPFVEIKLVCTSGTYVRTLAHDIGKKLGCGAHLSSLCRTRVGPFRLERALTFQRMQEGPDEISNFLVSIEDLFNGIPSLTVKNNFKDKIKNGMVLKSHHLGSVEKRFAQGERVTLKDEAGNILAIGNALVPREAIFDPDNQGEIFEYKRVLI